MQNAGPDDAIFRIDDRDAHSLVTPTPYAGGPWNPEHQHGGAASGLLARALTRLPSASPMRLARLTVEMFRGVPMTPLRLETTIVRDGRRIQSAEARLFSGETLVARATGLRIRVEPGLAELAAMPEPDPAMGEPPEAAADFSIRSGIAEVPGFVRAVEIEVERPSTPGRPANVWARLRCPLVEGEATDPVVRLATLVDFASGTGNTMDYTRYTSINPDLSIQLLCAPRSDWIGLRGVTFRSADGIGLSAATVHDLEGPVAHVEASLLLDRR